ncbi:MAG: redoxin family protein [Nitrosopumilus sp.]
MNKEIQTGLIFGGIIIVGITVISLIFSSVESDINNTGIIQKSNLKKVPDLQGIAFYHNIDKEELSSEMKNKVILYDIWTYSCINCIRTLPHIISWDEKYRNDGLLIIGIHSPEFDFEKDPENVKKAIEKFGVTYPVVMDNEMKTWKAFENRYWPRKYIADHEGYIRYDHIGEGGYQETEKIIQQLLQERSNDLNLANTFDSELVTIEEFEHTNFRTPELYFGYKLAQNRNQLGSSEGFQANKIVNYKSTNDLELHKFYLTGEWRNNSENMELISNEGKVRILYNAKQVNIVAAGESNLEILLDDELIKSNKSGDDLSVDSTLQVSESRLYNLIDSDDSETGILEIRIDKPGFKIFTFTFG